MIKIIAGKHRGRRIQTLPNERVRPTAARTREALFNILMHWQRNDETPLLPGCRMADLCCGSGAIGLEALSRGAAHVTFVDQSPASLACTRTNAETLGEVERCAWRSADIRTLPPAQAPYDLVFADPPYADDHTETLLSGLSQQGWLHSKSVVILETPATDKARDITHPAFILSDTRIYGKAKLSFLYSAFTL